MNPLAPYFAMGKLIALLGAVALICWQSSQIARWHRQFNSEHEAHLRDNAAHVQTVANYRAAAKAAEEADRANAARVKAAADQISKERSDEYKKRIADARARAERLRRLSQGEAGGADPCGAAAKDMPSVPKPAAGAAEATCKDRLPPSDQLIATEQAIQLDELIKWVKKVVGLDAHQMADRLLNESK